MAKAKAKDEQKSAQGTNDAKKVESNKTFNRKKALTLPHLKQGIDETLFIKMASETRVSDVPPKEGEEPATVANVINLATGEECIFIVPAILKGIFEKDLKGQKVTGLNLEITKKKKVPPKRYNPYEIYLLED